MMNDLKPFAKFGGIVAGFTTRLDDDTTNILSQYAENSSIGDLSPTMQGAENGEILMQSARQSGPRLHNEDPNDVPIGVGGDDDDSTLFIGGDDGPYVVSGGLGQDTLDLSAFDAGVRLSFFDGTFNKIGASADFLSTITSVEHAIGSVHNDVLLGDTGRNEFFGGDGDDQLVGYAGSDLLMGQGGDDNIRGGRGRDAIVGGDGDDLLNGGSGDDLVRGSDGNDYLWGVTGADLLEGGAGNDKLRGGSEDDEMFGGDGVDDLRGGTGDDFMSGDADNDWMSGGDGDDTMSGGAGNDALIGGAGADVFVFAQGSDVDRVKDWETGVDRIDLSDWGLGSVEALMSLVSYTNEMIQIQFSEEDYLFLYTVDLLDAGDVIL